MVMEPRECGRSSRPLGEDHPAVVEALTEGEMEQAGRARQLRDEDELSLREICAVLEAEAIRPKRGESWHPETARRMLANSTDQPLTLRRGTA
jgi:hypothetical protein